MTRHLLHRARELVVIDVAVAICIGRLTHLADVHVGKRQVEVAHLSAREDAAGELSTAAAVRGCDGACTRRGLGSVALFTAAMISSYERVPLWSVSMVRNAVSAVLNLS